MITLTESALLVAVGLVAGFLNTIAGGGSALTLPALMLIGLPVDVANGTNRVSIGVQTFMASATYQRAGYVDWKLVGQSIAGGVAGAVLGASLSAFWIPRAVLKPLLLTTMLVLSATMLLRPKAWGQGGEALELKGRPGALLGIFAAGLYGGLVQAGVGFVWLAVVAGMLRRDLAASNAVKVVCVFLLNIAALGVFVAADQVNWRIGGIMALGSGTGAVLGARFGSKANPRVLRPIIFGAILLTTIAALLKS